MPTVATATGAVDTANLGFTLMHEHVVTRSPFVYENWPHLWDRDAVIASAVKELDGLKATGVDSIVDLTTVDLGRDIPLIQEIAKQTNLQIVVCTGVWRDPPRYFQRRDPNPIADLFVRDIEEGIGETGVRAAIIKLATEPAVDEQNEMLLRAGARAHRRTGAPISTDHYVRSKCGLAQQDVFESEGVDLSRVVIGHSGDSDDLEYLSAIMRRGSYIGMDRFGIDMMLPFEKRVQVVADLCARGHANQMVVSHDTNCYMDTIPPEARKERMPNWHFLHISKDVIPALKSRGVTDEQIRTMTVDNPRKIFEKQGAY